MVFSLVNLGSIVFALICPYLIISYRRRIATLKTYIGMNKLLKSQKNQTVQNDHVLEELIKKDINANKNNAVTMIVLVVVYLIVVNFNIFNMYMILPLICLTLVFYFNNKYIRLYREKMKGIEWKG